MRRTELADPLFETAMADGVEWLCSLGMDDWDLLVFVFDWFFLLIDAADESCEPDDLHLTIDRLGLV